MKCILHIGTPKTGTTTIQKFLAINRKALSQLGYLYPSDSHWVGHRNLSVAGYDVTRRDDFTRYHRLHTNQDLLNYQKKTIKKLRKELSNAEAFKVTVFSSEHIQSRLTTSSELLRLKTLLNQLGYHDIEILVYLRRPVDLANSVYSQIVKGGSMEESPSSPKDDYWKNICDQYQIS